MQMKNVSFILQEIYTDRLATPIAAERTLVFFLPMHSLTSLQEAQRHSQNKTELSERKKKDV